MLCRPVDRPAHDDGGGGLLTNSVGENGSKRFVTLIGGVHMHSIVANQQNRKPAVMFATDFILFSFFFFSGCSLRDSASREASLAK
jgi:hypothetical protein